MNNVKLHKLLIAVTVLSWLAFIALLFLVYWNAKLVWGLFLSLVIACICTVMLSKFRSKNY